MYTIDDVYLNYKFNTKAFPLHSTTLTTAGLATRACENCSTCALETIGNVSACSTVEAGITGTLVYVCSKKENEICFISQCVIVSTKLLNAGDLTKNK